MKNVCLCFSVSDSFEPCDPDMKCLEECPLAVSSTFDQPSMCFNRFTQAGNSNSCIIKNLLTNNR